MSGALGIYCHIPFCRSKCAYCDFCSTPHWGESDMDAYVAALTGQMEAWLPAENPPAVDTVYFGGGTPSVLGAARLTALLEALKARVKLLPGCEITVEVNPESADEALFRGLKAAGVNRISMGVQTSDDALLRRIGRIHTFEKAREAVALCKAYCTDNLSLDLIYGLPGQTMKGWLQSVEDICALAPRHISCYALKLEEGTPLWREDPVLPDDDLQADMYLAAVSRLAELGYAQYEISNFAQLGFHSRHNSRYWDLSEYLGLGCAAHSCYGGKRFSFTSDINAFVRSAGKIAPIPEDDLSEPDRLGEFVMLALRTCGGIDEQAFFRRWGRDFSPVARRLQPYIATGHVLREDGLWRLTPEGFLVSNSIIGQALDALAESE